MKNCGHAMCKSCAVKFVKDEKSTCPVCETRTKPKQVLHLVSEGTGFAAKGNAKAAKETVAFQC